MTSEIWVCDFEFISREGDKPLPVCFVGTELNTGRTVSQWLYGEDKSKPLIDFSNPDLTYIAFYSVAEMSCHLVLNWPIPANIIDLYAEFRVLTNAGDRVSSGLLDACQHFGISTIDQAYKDKMRDRVLQGAPYNTEDQAEILKYCESDIIETAALFKAMSPIIDGYERALFRGQYMAINAMIESNGVPMDSENLNLMREHWELVKLQLIQEVKKDFDFFDGLTFKTAEFAAYLIRNNMTWDFTDAGNLKMDDDTWKEMVLVYPQLQPVRDARNLLGKFKKLHIACGEDGRNRGMLSPFSTKTGRNAPKVSCIFTNPSWMRSLIRPPEGETLAYLDYEQQEFFIAACLSGDKSMQDAYYGGDPYLKFAKLAGAIPPEGTKKTHKLIRDLYKTSCLAIQYGMRAASLSVRVGRPLAYAHELIKQHERLFPKYWNWQHDLLTQAKLTCQIHTLYGWRMKVEKGTSKEDLTLGNFLMQATGADILRIACYLLTEAEIKVIAPVHDAVMISVNAATATEDIKRADEILKKASVIVLGQPLRTEILRIDYPGRYNDEKGANTWNKVLTILEGIKSGAIVFNPEDLGSKWAKQAAKLDRISHNNLSNWYDGHDKDTIDFQSLKDSTLSGTENRKNIKSMWKGRL